ncbi:hypothetical protein [Methylovulum psychrotolerans]|jgi:hypothetical protein|uniref:Uncharacterized protein n=1 Tax=Methylovulum psychrotolerans TaxID=1704499 RepID=A0A1Z4C132_9GAMM|nr:hypothetical protein [Methylovulum psychrotolerans]ASF47242.1 hypothetical protein CEK71_14840 [Methylovulum psychrotolerans]
MKKLMYAKYDLKSEGAEKYKDDHYGSYAIAAIINKELNLVLVEFSVHHSERPDRSFTLSLQEETIYIHLTHSYKPLTIRLSARLQGSLDTNEYEYAKIIRNAVMAFDQLHYQPKEAWYWVSLTNTAKPQPKQKSDIFKIEDIINSLALHGKQRGETFSELSIKLLSQIDRHGYDSEDLEKFIEDGGSLAKLSQKGKDFMRFWVDEGKHIKGQYAVALPSLIGFNFFEPDQNGDAVN